MSALTQVVRDALTDSDRVNRLHAAYAVRFLEPDRESTLALVRERLLTEPEFHVAAVLTNELAALANSAPEAADAVLGEITETDLWQARLASENGGGTDTLDPLISLVVWLAIACQTPVATTLVHGWSGQPLRGHASRRLFWQLRPWLALPANRAAERRRAFELLQNAASALEEQRVITERAQTAELYRIADAIINQLYFASGAFGVNGGDERTPRPAEEGFAAEVFRVIEVLTGFREPSIVHHMLETLGHVAPADPRTAFLLVEQAISAGDAYTFDSMAADKTVALIARYLADFRETVASDADLLTAVRRVLDAFVRVGWPAAVALSYRLGDAFR